VKVPGILEIYPFPKKVDINTFIFFILILNKLLHMQLLVLFQLYPIFQQFSLLNLLNFYLLKANLEATDVGLEGEALLGVSVSQPPLLKLVPKKILESTGHSVLNGILLGIKSRVQQQLVKDFLDWCESNEI